MDEPRQFDFAEVHPTYLYRTKDFRGVVHHEGLQVVGTHRAASEWLSTHKEANLRAQFVNERGELIAADNVELQALIASLQKEYMQ